MQRLTLNLLKKISSPSSLLNTTTQSASFFWRRKQKKEKSQVQSWLKQKKTTDQQKIIQNQHQEADSTLKKYQKFQTNPNQFQLLDDFDLNYISTKLRSKRQDDTQQSGALSLSSGQQSGKQDFLRRKGLTQEQIQGESQLTQQRVRQIFNETSLNQRARRDLQTNMKQFTDIYSIQQKMEKAQESQQDLMLKESQFLDKAPFIDKSIKNLSSKKSLLHNKRQHQRKDQSKVQEFSYKFDAVEQSQQIKNILQYLKVPQNRSILPPQSQADKGRITVFCELDEILSYIFLPDDTLGTMANPAIRQADFEFIIDQFKQLTFIYKNDYLQQFLSLLDREFEPILYTSSNRFLAEIVLQKLNAKNIFRHILDQEHCYFMEKQDEQICEMIKQIKKFIGPFRSMKSSVLIDANQFSCIFNPDNIIQIEPFRGDVHHYNNSLEIVSQHLKQIQKQYQQTQDVRIYLENEFMTRKILQNAKVL